MSHQELLRTLPPVTELVDDGRLAGLMTSRVGMRVFGWIRESLEEVRNWLFSQGEDESMSRGNRWANGSSPASGTFSACRVAPL
ncbi:MAG: hypothetical protein CM1200mP2_10700 [Planctomycetaceae bacterium]|nr:MAG: hypothetical protein CM1200mP2_10700 [Planctomycetaceae bacterium]